MLSRRRIFSGVLFGGSFLFHVLSLFLAAALLLQVCFRLPFADARVTSLTVDGVHREWVFVDKFAYEATDHSANDTTTSNTGFLEWDVQGNNLIGLNLVLYDDESDSFPSFYSNALSATRSSASDSDPERSVHSHTEIAEEAVEDDQLNVREGRRRRRRGGGETTGRLLMSSCTDRLQQPPAKVIIDLAVQSSGSLPLNHPSRRPRFWYFAVTACGMGSFPNQNTDIRLTMTNPGSTPTHQFSVDEYGMFGFSVFLFLIMFGFAGLAGRNVYVVIKDASHTSTASEPLHTRLHPIMKTYLACLTLWLCGIFFSFIHWMIYADDGKGVPGLRGFALVADTSAHIVFMALLYLVAHGYAITFPTLRNRKWLALLFTVLVIVHIVLFVWMEIGMDPASTVYGYETPPGIVLCCLRLPMMIFFIWAIRTTLQIETDVEKRRFYKLFGICGSVWFLVLPVIVIIAALVVPWRRAAAVFIVSQLFFSIAVLAMAFVLWPTRLMSRLFKLTPVMSVPAVLSDQPYEEL
eukprot:ANDGO_04179.mRNA.1 hypothetical protein SAMD00019534_063650